MRLIDKYKQLAAVVSLLLVLLIAPAQGQQAIQRDTMTVASGATGTYLVMIASDTHAIEYVISGGPATASIVLQGCMRGGTCTTLETSTATTNTVRSVAGLYDYLTIAPTFTGGTTPSVKANFTSIVSGNAAGTLGTTPVSGTVTATQATAANFNAQVQGPAAAGAAVSGNPLMLGGSDGTNAQVRKVVSAANLAASPQVGIDLAEKGARIAVVSTPAVSNQATASVTAGGAGVVHVVDCVWFSAGSTTAPALTQMTVNVRDGATGAGTVKSSWTLIIPATTGQNVAPFSVCGLNIPGTANTAMTVEFSALLTNLFENVGFSYFNVN